MSFLYSYPDYSGVSLKISTNNLVPILCSGLKPENNQPINMPYSNTTQNSIKTTYNNCAHSWSSVAYQKYPYPTGSCVSDESLGPGLAYSCGPAFWNPRTTLRGHGGLPPSNNDQKRETWINNRIGISTQIPVGEISTGVSKKSKVRISTITWGGDSKIKPWARKIFLTDINANNSIFAVSWQRLEPNNNNNYHSYIQLNEVEKGTAEVWDPNLLQFMETKANLTERLAERFPDDPNMKDIVVVTNHGSHQYSIGGLSAGLYCVQIISRSPYGYNLGNAPPEHWQQQYASYSFVNAPEGVPSTVWATAPTFFAIIEPAPTRIETINTNGAVAPYDEETRSYKGTINVKVATNSAFSPDVGDLNTYPSLGPLVVGLFPIVEDSLGEITPSKSISTSTKESVNNDNLNYIITGVKPGKYYIGAQNTGGDISYFQSDPVHIKDGKIEFEMQDIFAPRSYDPNNRSVASEAWNVDNPNFYGTCFCSVESIASPTLLFTPVLDITTKTIDNTRLPRSYPSVVISNYKSITSTSDPDKQVHYYKVSGLSPGAYEITISSNPDPDMRFPALTTTLKRTMIMPSANLIKVKIITKEDTSGSTAITKGDHSESCLILSNMPNGSFEVAIDGPKEYQIFEEFIPFSLDHDNGNYSYFKTGIEYYEYKKKTVENTYTIEYKLGLQPALPKTDTEARLDPIFIDGERVQNVNEISNLPSCYLEVIIKDIFDNRPSMISAEFKNINLMDVTMREYRQQISIFPEVYSYQILKNVIDSNGILVDIPEKIFSIYEPVNLIGCSTRKGSGVISHNMTEGEKTRVKTKMAVLGDCIDPNTITSSIITSISNEYLILSKGAIDTCENTTLTIISRDRLHGDILANITNKTNKIKFVGGNIGLLKKGDILIAKGLATDTRIVGIDTLNKTIDISKDAVATILNAKIIIILAPPPELISPDIPNTPPVDGPISRNPSSVRVPVDHGFAGWPSDPDTHIPPAPPAPPSSAPKQTGTLRIVVTPARSTYTITEKTGWSRTCFFSVSLELLPGVYTIQGDEDYLRTHRLLNDTHTVSVTRDSKESINLVFNKCPTTDIPYTITPTTGTEA